MIWDADACRRVSFQISAHASKKKRSLRGFLRETLDFQAVLHLFDLTKIVQRINVTGSLRNHEGIHVFSRATHDAAHR
jgi:hypothetical protein